MSASVLRRIPCFEGLESRRVLANSVTTLSAGLLSIEGTSKNDKIVVAVAGEFGDQLSVQVNKTVTFFALADVSEIQIDAGAGNDKVSLGADVLVGAHLDGGKGNDWLQGGGGSDVLLGGQGNDHLSGGGGDDVLVGDAGNDRLWGGAGNDELEGSAGHDKLSGDEGDDVLSGGAGHDRIHGGDGDDEAWGGNGHDLLYGGAGDDELFGEEGHDLIYGQDGNDWLEGGSGKDKLVGGLGDDSLKGGAGNDHLDGGEGVNLLDGDEGRNKLKNGTETDLDQPPPPPDVPEYLTTLQSEGTSSGQIIYQNSPLGDGFEQTLEIDVQGGVEGDMLAVVIDGRVLGILTVDATGQAHAKFSTVPDQAGERAFALNFTLVDGAEVSIGPELSGMLNLSQA